MTDFNPFKNVKQEQHPTDANLVILKRICPFCGKEHSISVPHDEWENGKSAYASGYLVQRAFPTFSADAREMLVSGICHKCWENI